MNNNFAIDNPWVRTALINKPLIVMEIVNIGFGMPMQWNGILKDPFNCYWLDKNNSFLFLYARERHGNLSICLGESQDDAINGYSVFGCQTNTNGFLSYDQLRLCTKDYILFPNILSNSLTQL